MSTWELLFSSAYKPASFWILENSPIFCGKLPISNNLVKSIKWLWSGVGG